MPKETSRQQGQHQTSELQSAYSALITLVQHSDTQIHVAQRFHVALLSAVAPALAYFSLVQADWQILVALTVLAFVLAAHWALMATKLTLQKLCWTQALRQLEAELFPAGQGAFTQQQIFFEELADQNIGWFDKLLMCTKKSKSTTARLADNTTA